MVDQIKVGRVEQNVEIGMLTAKHNGSAVNRQRTGVSDLWNAISPRKSGAIKHVADRANPVQGKNLKKIPIPLAERIPNKNVNVSDSLRLSGQKPCKASNNRKLIGHL